MIQGRPSRGNGDRRHLIIVAVAVENPDNVRLISEILTEAVSFSKKELLALKAYSAFRERYLL